MASVTRPRGALVWIASFRMPTGESNERGRPMFQRVQRSTGVTDRSRALQIAVSYERAAGLTAEKRWADENARQFLAEISVLAGSSCVGSRPIDEFFDSWSIVWRKTVAAKSWLNARSVFRDFLDWLGPRRHDPIGCLAAIDLASFRDSEIALGKAPTTINKELSFLAQAFDEAVAQGLTEKNLARGLRIKRARKAAQTRSAFSFQQFAELVRRTAPGQRGTRGGSTPADWQTFLIISGYTGGRQQEVARLTWGTVDFENRRIGLVRTKTGGDVHWIPMHESLLAHLSGRADATPARSTADFVMPGFAGTQGRYLSKTFRDLILPRIGIRQPYVKHKQGTRHGRKLARYSIHSLRHSLPTWLNAAGVSDATRMRIVGHEDDNVGRAYTHADSGDARVALARIPSLSPTMSPVQSPLCEAREEKENGCP